MPQGETSMRWMWCLIAIAQLAMLVVAVISAAQALNGHQDTTRSVLTIAGRWLQFLVVTGAFACALICPERWRKGLLIVFLVIGSLVQPLTLLSDTLVLRPISALGVWLTAVMLDGVTCVIALVYTLVLHRPYEEAAALRAHRHLHNEEEEGVAAPATSA